MSVAKRRVWVCSVCLQRLYVRVERALVQTGGSAGVWWILERMLSTLRAGHALSGGSRRGQPLYRQGSPSSVAGDGDYSRAVRRAAWFSMCRRTTACVCLSVGFAYLCGGRLAARSWCPGKPREGNAGFGQRRFCCPRQPRAGQARQRGPGCFVLQQGRYPMVQFCSQMVQMCHVKTGLLGQDQAMGYDAQPLSRRCCARREGATETAALPQLCA